MKFFYQILIILAVQSSSYSAYAGSFEVEDKDGKTAVRAVLDAPAARVGKPVNLWISAVYNGVPYFYNGSSWTRYTGGPLPVAVKGKLLAARNTLTVAQGTDLQSLPGADLYVGYGVTEEEMKSSEGKLKKVGKLGKRLRWPAPRAR